MRAARDDGAISAALASNAVAASVRSSRYFTMSGVERHSPFAFAYSPDAGRVPGPTTAPSQRVENDVVGAACGVMDQMASACGEPGKLLRLLCQPAEIEGNIEIPAGFKFLGLGSGVRHAVSGSDYTSVRIGAFMGFRILAEIVGVRSERAGERVVFEFPSWGRYLANVTPSEWNCLLAQVPESMRGGDFLRTYGGVSDTVTKVDPHRTYAVRQPTAHPILEHHRVRTFAALLPHAHEPGVAELLGELMYQSHASYTACGLGCAATDAIVGWARGMGPAAGVYGAKITGGGSGGAVAVFLTDRFLANHKLVI